MTILESAFILLGSDARRMAVVRHKIRALAKTTVQKWCSDVDAARERNRKLKAKIAEDRAAA
jgi:hypothetical protein